MPGISPGLGLPVVEGVPPTVEPLLAPVGGTFVVVPMPPTVDDDVPVDGTPVAVPTPPTVELYGVVDGRPGLARFTPGVVVPLIDVDGVPMVEPEVVEPEAPSVGVDSVVPDEDVPIDGVVVVDGVLVDGVVVDGEVVDGEVVDDELLELPFVDGDSCEIVGLRSLGISGRGAVAVVVDLGRTRSPSGIPLASACRLAGRGPANTNSDATASAAR